MGINFGDTRLESSSGLMVTYVIDQYMKLDTAGRHIRFAAGHTMFRAGSNSTTWTAIAAANTWTPIVFDTANSNTNLCYNTSNGRFTAPVTGVYLLTAGTYVQGKGAGWYVHSMFWVNGGSNTRRPGGPLHRIHGHSLAAEYQTDTETVEIANLIAGDYVQFYNYSGGFVNNWYPAHSRFEGYLLG